MQIENKNIENDKRTRSTNFTNEEKMCCLNIIKKYQHIIENKATGTVSWKEKEKTWKLIEREFNMVSTTYRNAEVLKRFYNNKKKETRKQVALEKANLNKTGGGRNDTIKNMDDPILNLTLDIINKKSVFGLHNPFDDDAQINENETESFIETDKVNRESVDENMGEEEIVVEIIEEESNNFMMEPTGSNNLNVNTPTKLKVPIRKNTRGAQKSTEWTNRRRPHISRTENLSERYEEIAKIKKNVLELQLDMLKKDQENIIRREERDNHEREIKEKRSAQEFQLKIMSLELDIEIKKEQLKALKNVNNV